VVGCVDEKGFSQSIGVESDDDAEGAESFAKRHSSGGKHVAGKLIKLPQKLASLKMDVTVAFFESIEFFQNGDRNGNVVFFETENAASVVKDHIGVENEKPCGTN
jgi:hypothetical protein